MLSGLSRGYSNKLLNIFRVIKDELEICWFCFYDLFCIWYCLQMSFKTEGFFSRIETVNSWTFSWYALRLNFWRTGVQTKLRNDLIIFKISAFMPNSVSSKRPSDWWPRRVRRGEDCKMFLISSMKGSWLKSKTNWSVYWLLVCRTYAKYTMELMESKFELFISWRIFWCVFWSWAISF